MTKQGVPVPSFPDFMDNFNNLYNISYLEFSSIWMNGADTDYGTPQMQRGIPSGMGPTFGLQNNICKRGRFCHFFK